MDWPILAGVPETERRALLSVARRRRFSRGEVVFHQHDPADTLHLISKGRFAVREDTPLGDSVIFAVLGPSDFFGELALIGGEHRTASVEALEQAETWSIHQLDFERLRRAHPSVSDVLIAALVTNVSRLSRHLVEALHVPAEERVIRRLAELADVYRNGDAEISIPLTQDHLAALAGTSRATVNKVLRAEQRRGTLQLARARIAVLDRAALRPAA